MERGFRRRMERFGRRELLLAGLPINMAAGCGKTTTVGPGLITIHGVGRHFTMVVGFGTEGTAGAGGPVLLAAPTTGAPRSSGSSALAPEASAWESVSALEMWVGWPWLRKKYGAHGMDAAGTGGAATIALLRIMCLSTT